MIFPELGSQYYSTTDKSILSKMEAFYANSITINQSFWSEADTDTRFEVGDQTLWSDLYGNLPANRRRQFNFNRIRRVINLISGHQRKNRKSTICVPVENGDQETADQFTKILIWINNQEQVLETISESFHGALVTGMNLMQVWIDYRNDPVSGNIRVDNCSYNSFLIDPYFRKADLSDCNAIWKRSFLTKPECISLMPSKADEILDLPFNDSGTGRDGKFQFMPESYNYGYKNLLTYDEFYYRDYRTQKMLVDSQTGETQEWKGDKDENLEAFLETYPQITLIESEVPTVKLAIVIQGKVMYDGPNPLGIDNYPFVPVFAYYNPQMPYFPQRIQGVVRGLRDAQYLYNRRRIIELDILESQINSGWKYKENALVNPEDVFLSGQGRGLALKEEASMDDVQQIQAPQVPPSMIQLSELLAKEVMEISGVNEELLGSADDDKAGILSMLRQGAGLTTLQVLFDNLDRAQRLLGRLMIDLIQNNFTPGKIKKILEGEEPSPQFYNKAFGRYHAVVEEGVNTGTQKQMQFAQMLHLMQAGVPIPAEELLEASTLQNKTRIIESIKAQQQAQAQAQAQQSEMAMQLQMAQAELAKARAAADMGLYNERTSRVTENRALAIQKLHEANHQDQLALLEKVKALKELDDMDIAHLEKLITMANGLKQQEAVNAERGVERLAQVPVGVEQQPQHVEQQLNPNAQQSNLQQSMQGLM
jgi:hypothetical protein